jgi:hypothetical protein
MEKMRDDNVVGTYDDGTEVTNEMIDTMINDGHVLLKDINIDNLCIERKTIEKMSISNAYITSMMLNNCEIGTFVVEKSMLSKVICDEINADVMDITDVYIKNSTIHRCYANRANIKNINAYMTRIYDTNVCGGNIEDVEAKLCTVVESVMKNLKKLENVKLYCVRIVG